MQFVLDKYCRNVADEVRAAVDDTMKDMVSETKANAPSQSGKYHDCISSKLRSNYRYNVMMRYTKVWYVKSPRYRLAHLLDKGHKNRNGTWCDGDGHIANATDHAKAALERRLKDAIQSSRVQNGL